MSDFQHVSTGPRADQLARQHGPARDRLDLRGDGIEQPGDQASRALASHHRCDALGAMLELDREGFQIIALPVQESGLVDFAVFKAALQPGAVLASVTFVDKEMHVTREIAAIGPFCRARQILLLVDAALNRSRRIAGRSDVVPRSRGLRPQRHWRAVCGAPPRMRIGCQLHGGVHASGRQGTAIAPVEIHCSIFAEDAIKTAMSNFPSRQTILGAAADDQ
ncbi:hypothetical protein BZM26_30835 [Paraburkholderia strydomiana]|nr:hypothetical protein BZM26_30835 [Paraburkholderia strydomiana]